MKKILLAIVASLLLVTVSLAQEKQQKAPEKTKMEQHKKPVVSECCMMKGGKMIHYKNGKETEITKEMEMNGIKVMPDGTCKMKNGKTVKLMEGECCDRHGKVHKDCEKMMKKG